MEQQSKHLSSINREQAQDLALKYSYLYKDLFLEWGTGVGKSLAALKIAEAHGGFWVILCSERVHIENWNQEIEKHNIKANVHICTYASMHKLPKNTNPNIIFDEVHRFFTDIREDHYFELGTGGRHILLSATLPHDKFLNFKNVFPDAYRYTFSLNTAVSQEILPQPKFYILNCELDNTVKSETFTLRWGTQTKSKTFRTSVDYSQIRKFTKRAYPSVEIEVFATEREKYDYLLYEAEKARIQLSSTGAQWALHKNNLAFGAVKKYLTDKKERFVKYSVSKLQEKDKKGLVFTNSTELANVLGNEDCVIHSKYSAKHNDKVLADFNEGTIKTLYTVKMLTEGQNISAIDYAVLVQLDNKQITTIQRSGRAMRAKEPVIYILVFRDTRDTKYLDKALTALKMEVKYYDLKVPINSQ